MSIRYFIRVYSTKPCSHRVSTSRNTVWRATPPRGYFYLNKDPPSLVIAPRAFRTLYRMETSASSKKVMKSTVSVPSSTMESFNSSLYLHDNKHHLLLATSGSAATVYIPSIIRMLSRHNNLSIRLVLILSAAQFLARQSSEQEASVKCQTSMVFTWMKMRGQPHGQAEEKYYT